MKNFNYADPKSVKSAVASLGNDWNEAVVKGGGTDLMGEMKSLIISPEKVVNLKNIDRLEFIKSATESGLRIGSAATITEIAESSIIKEKYFTLAQAASELASPQIRNTGTIGGNLCQRPRCWYYRNKNILCLKKGGSQCFAFTGENKYHCIFGGGPCFMVYPSDLAPVLMSYDAKIKILGKNGERELELSKFYVLPRENLRRENVLKPDEIITEIIVPRPKAKMKSIYIKQGIRQTLDFAVCSAAVSISINGLKCEDVRIVLGGAAPKPWRSIMAENELKGKIILESTAESAAKAAVSNAQPMKDNRYKIKLFRNIIKKAIIDAMS